MKKQIKANSTKPVRKIIRASRTTEDMLNAFEAKLAEFGIESKTDVACSADLGRSVDIDETDYYDNYEDVGGGFGEVGAVYSLGEIKEMWNATNEGDPCMSDYPSFEDWWHDTKNNFMQAAY